jgi:hypothetical protein
MAEPVSLRYHARAWRLLGREPALSADAVRAIEECEARCGVRLPAAVREWYSLVGAVEVLAEHEAACGPASLDELLTAFAAAARGGRRATPPARFVFYGPWRQNTGYEAELDLTGPDDPPVFVHPDTPVEPFSGHVLGLAWWKRTFDCSHLFVRAEFGPPDLDYLAEHFEELPRLVAPDGSHTLRFFGWRGRVEVVSQGDPSSAVCAASFTLAADDEERLLDVYGFVGACHGRPVHLVAIGPTPDAALKARFRTRFPTAEVAR